MRIHSPGLLNIYKVGIVCPNKIQVFKTHNGTVGPFTQRYTKCMCHLNRQRKFRILTSI